MKYMLLVYSDENALSPEAEQECYEKATAVADELRQSGRLIAADPLHPTTTATSIRVREGRTLVTDGPFAETREQLGGYFLIEAENLDEALGIAARLPMVHFGTIEVRPIFELANVTV